MEEPYHGLTEVRANAWEDERDIPPLLPREVNQCWANPRASQHALVQLTIMVDQVGLLLMQ